MPLPFGKSARAEYVRGTGVRLLNANAVIKHLRGRKNHHIAVAAVLLEVFSPKNNPVKISHLHFFAKKVFKKFAGFKKRRTFAPANETDSRSQK